MDVKISVPGKVILMGEHAVVYGKPALVAAVERRIKIELKIKNQELWVNGKSEIPIGVGMGSSAALAVCQVAAISEIFNLNLSLGKINTFAYEIEKENHKLPSGIDNTICTYGGILWYRKEAEFLKTFQKIPLTDKIKHLTENFLLINTGKPKESTAEMVERVKKLYNRRSKYVEKILNEQERETKKMMMGLMTSENKGKRWLREAIRLGERNLERLGVVSQKTKELIRNLEKLGAVAKISGAGGRKDKSGLVLVYSEDKQSIINYCQNLGLETIDFIIAESGLKVIKNLY